MELWGNAKEGKYELAKLVAHDVSNPFLSQPVYASGQQYILLQCALCIEQEYLLL